MRVAVATFDLAMLRTGWAVGTPDIADGKTRPGWGNFEPTPGEHKESETMARFRALLMGLHERHSLTHIVYEHIFIDHSEKRHEYVGPEAQFMMAGILHEFGGTHGIKVTKVTVQTWRALIYGASRPPPHLNLNKADAYQYWKDRAIDWARACGYSPITYEDEAEALAILNWALSVLDQKFSAATGQLFRRAELQQMNKDFRGE